MRIMLRTVRRRTRYRGPPLLLVSVDRAHRLCRLDRRRLYVRRRRPVHRATALRTTASNGRASITIASSDARDREDRTTKGDLLVVARHRHGKSEERQWIRRTGTPAIPKSFESVPSG